MVCATDSLEAFSVVTSRAVSRRHSCAILVLEIQTVAASVGCVQFSHVLRSGNCYGDFLAHVGATASSTLVYWETI